MDPAKSIPKQLYGPQDSQLMRQAARRVGAPVGSPHNNEWVDAVNSSSNEQLDSFFGKRTIPFYQNKFKANQQFQSSAPYSVSQGSAIRPNQERYRTGAAQTSGGVRQPSQGIGFQSLMPSQQSFSRQSPAWQQQYEQTFNQAMADDRQRQIDDANNRVDSRLAARQGFYPSAQQRQAGWFGRGWGMPAPQEQPEERRLTFDPVQNAAANRALFAQHTNSMQNNPAYAQRVNAERAARRDQLADREAIANGRRQGAIEAAGASQQLRNLMAGRGALGAGRDGFGALMSLAAMRNPNEAFGDFGPSFMGLNAPGMQTERLGAEGRMFDQNLGAQERMFGQNLATQQRLAQQELAAREAEAWAQRSFMASQGANDYKRQRELADLGYTREREIADRNARLQIALGSKDPMAARQMLGIYDNPDRALDPTQNPGIDIPRFQPSDKALGDRRQTFMELRDWAARNNLDESNPYYQSEVKRLQVEPLPEEAQSWLNEIKWREPLFGRYNYSLMAPSYAQQDQERRIMDFLRRRAMQANQGGGVVAPQSPAMAPSAPSQPQFNSYDTVW